MNIFTALIDWLFRAPCEHRWTRPFRDADGVDKMRCTICGSARRTRVQFGKAA
jgi:hypothetical protein